MPQRTRRRTPVPPLRPPSIYTLGVPVRTAGGVWNQLEKAGVPNVTGVWTHVIERPMFLVVSIEQEYAGHSKQAGLAATSTPNGSYGGRYVVVDDHDVDVTNLEEVSWAICTRCPADPVIDDREHPTSGRVIIDATRPYGEEFPDAIHFDDEYRSEMAEKWDLDSVSI